MDIYVMRHSLAEARCPFSIHDDDRRLTEEGVRRARLVAEGLKRRGLKIDRALASPFVRARETAAIACEVLGLPAAGEVPALEPGGKVEAVLRAAAAEVAGASGPGGILLVSHQPLCGDLVERLLGTDLLHTRYEPATVCCVRVSGMPPRYPGELVFLAPPCLLEP